MPVYHEYLYLIPGGPLVAGTGSISATSTVLSRPQSIWLKIEGASLYDEDKAILLSTQWLDDRIVNAAQELLKKQSNLKGFQCTLYGQKMARYSHVHGRESFVQVVNVRNTHWLTVSNVGCDASTVTVYDSLPATVGHHIKKHICHFWKCEGKQATFQVANMQRQPNPFDCGLFALASATDLTYGNNPITSKYEVGKMRPHLLQCFEDGKMNPFPQKERRIPLGCRYKYIQRESLYCICHMPNDKDLPMICCDKWLV